MEPKEEEAVEMVVRAREVGRRTLPIYLDSDETVVQLEDKNKATGPRSSNRLQGRRG